MTGAAPLPAPGDKPAMRTRFSLCFLATDLETRANIGIVARRLQLAGLARERTTEIEIALTEAVNNVVEHAYAEVGAGSIRLLCSLRPGQLDIRIFDTGRPLPEDRLPPGLAADLSVAREDLPEGGFGWFLIRAFTTEIRYDRCAGCNHLSLRFAV